jgi:phosphogluconate dehydratase
MGFVIRELIDAGLLHADIRCVHGGDLRDQAREPWLDGTRLDWRAAPATSLDAGVLRPVAEPFAPEGGMRLLQGNLGRAVVKVSAVAPEHRVIRAPARVFDSQDALLEAFKAGQLTGDFVAVIRGQGPRANGMPELHKLTPTLSLLQDRGQRVALLTDGRMSGASGTVLAAIHVVPEAAQQGSIGRLLDGDPVTIDAERGELSVDLDPGTLAARVPRPLELGSHRFGFGRELFGVMRSNAGTAEQGACALFGEG